MENGKLNAASHLINETYIGIRNIDKREWRFLLKSCVKEKPTMTIMHVAYDHIVLAISVLLASTFHVKLEFLDGFIERSIIVKALV
jgi:hypothetical protein